MHQNQLKKKQKKTPKKKQKQKQIKQSQITSSRFNFLFLQRFSHLPQLCHLFASFLFFFHLVECSFD